MQTYVIQFLEARSLSVGARARVDGEVEFKELIRHVGAGTGFRNCCTFREFRVFLVSSHSGTINRIHRQESYEWMKHV